MTDFRTKIRQDWPPERISAALEELASAETTRSHDVTCKACGNTYSYKLPAYDGRTRLSAIQWVSEHGYGRAVQAEPDKTKPLDKDIDPSKLDPEARKQLITTLRARLSSTPESGATPDLQS